MKHSYELSETISNLLIRQPFFAVILIDLCNLVESDQVPLAGTDGKNIFINPKTFAARPVQERTYILAHETLHVVYQHIPRSKQFVDRGFGPDGKKVDKKKLNVSQDFVINSILNESNIGTMPSDALSSDQYTHKHTFEDVYCRLPPENPEKENFDEHLAPGENSVVPTEAEIQRTLVSAASAAKAQGKLSGGLARLVRELVEPKQNWREILKDFVVSTLGREQPSWRRTNRRRLAIEPHAAFPGLQGMRIGNIGIIIDTSGSISTEELACFLSEIHQIVKDTHPERCVIFWTDSTVAGIDEIDEDTDPLSLNAKGGGGTHMPAAFPVINLEFPEGVECILCLTDGYTDFGEEPGVPMLWAITSDVTAPYGTNIKLEV